MNRIHVVLADDHALVRAGIRALLDRLPDVQTVGEAGTGAEALALIESCRPDVAIVDLSMGAMSGLDVVARAAASVPAVRIIVLSMHANEGYVAQALRAGAAGYLIKDAASDELELAIAAVRRGETYLSPGISRAVISGFLAGPGAGGRGTRPVLTPRQREVLALIARGKSTREIARLLGLSVKTVETHRAAVMDRLDIHDVAGLVKHALRAGLIPPVD